MTAGILLVADMLDPEQPAAFVALVEAMNLARCAFVLEGNDELRLEGAELPQWCGPVIVHWFDVVVAAHQTRHTHPPHRCDECFEVMFLASDRVGRRCFMPDCRGHVSIPVLVPFD